jgi:hypothetical protein
MDRRKEPRYTSSTKMAERDFIEAIQADIDEMAVSLVKLKAREFQVRGAAPAHSSTLSGPAEMLEKCRFHLIQRGKAFHHTNFATEFLGQRFERCLEGKLHHPDFTGNSASAFDGPENRCCQ